MLSLKRTTSKDLDFQKLTREFDEYLIDINGDERDFFAQFNNIYIQNVIVCYDGNEAVGCGAFKEYEPNVAEIKRMFVNPNHRNKGIAKMILQELLHWTQEENFTSAILETAQKLKPAIALYHSFGFEIIPNYGQYINVESSVCMKKILK